MVRNQLKSVKIKKGLIVRDLHINQGRERVLMIQWWTVWKGHCSTDKSYSRDNRLIFFKSSYRQKGLAPRCRLVATWRGSTWQRLGCSPIKAARELGSERRETVRSISSESILIWYWRNFFLVREDWKEYVVVYQFFLLGCRKTLGSCA